MNAKQSSQPNATGVATRNVVGAGAIQPGSALPGFRDASRPIFRDSAEDVQYAQKSGESNALPGRIHVAFTGLLAFCTIAMLALGR